MGTLSFAAALALRALILLVPLAVAWLAIRRLVRSETTNAWIYAATGLLTAFTATGLAPWAFGVGEASWYFFPLAALSAPLWVAVVMICDLDRRPAYGEEVPSVRPLLLTDPIAPVGEAASGTAMFRSSRGGARSVRIVDRRDSAEAFREVLTVAREMRGNVSTEARRMPKTLVISPS